MAFFRDDRRDKERLDWHLLQHGAVTLYHKASVLAQDSAWLQQNGYRLFTLDAGAWQTKQAFHEEARRVLGFPSHYNNSLAAWIDNLAELEVPPNGGTALQFRRYDAFARADREFAQTLLETIESTSRGFLLTGRRFLALVQSDDPRLHFERIGAVPVNWNAREWTEADRGLRKEEG